MKKILSLVSLLVVTAFVPDVSALPVFARQTGMACRACHFQHFPALNGFGRAFKASGYTMMGAQGKIEDEQLSIPNTLNMGVLVTTGYETASNRSQNGTITTAAQATAAQAVNPAAGISNGQFNFPADGGELSLFFGGHVTDSIGFLSELALTGTGAGPANTNSAKLPMLFDVGNNTRIGLVAMATAAQGAAHSFELLNTGAANTHKVVTVNGFQTTYGNGTNNGAGSHINDISAAQYLGTNGRANGFSFVAVNPNIGYVNIGKYGIAAAAVGASLGSSGVNGMNTTYTRVVGMFEVGGWDSAVGIQNFSGLATDNITDTKANIVDGQMQGEAGGMPLGLYASYGVAPTAANGNLFNPYAAVAGATSKQSFNIAGELGVIPHKATVQLALRSGRNGAGTLDNDNAIMVGGTYELAQNAELSLTHTTNSGSAWNALPVTGDPIGKLITSLFLEVLF